MYMRTIHNYTDGLRSARSSSWVMKAVLCSSATTLYLIGNGCRNVPPPPPGDVECTHTCTH